ncbi:hypothetical protein [Salinispora arenicola]|uniref:hypothetical protein n=1 Tax=Salinispora arenicola TaxID=168697 RepID=UPI000364D262|nr:hypothetical protein [Salinispora arenicola]
MSYVIVSEIHDPQRAAEAAELAGDPQRAQQIRSGGRCTVVAAEGSTVEAGGGLYLPRNPTREQLNIVLRDLNKTVPLPGSRYYSRFDFDPDWSKQRQAAEAAMSEMWRHRDRNRWAAVPAVDAFCQAYYGWGDRHTLPDPTRKTWLQADQVNYTSGAVMLANALAGMRTTHPTAPAGYLLNKALDAGWKAAPSQYPEPSNGAYVRGSVLELAFGLAYIMRAYGEQSGLDRLVDAVNAGEAGNS